MARPIKNDAEALRVAVSVIMAQGRLLSAYRTGSTRTPGSAIDTINRDMPRLTAYLEESHS